MKSFQFSSVRSTRYSYTLQTVCQNQFPDVIALFVECFVRHVYILVYRCHTFCQDVTEWREVGSDY